MRDIAEAIADTLREGIKPVPVYVHAPGLPGVDWHAHGMDCCWDCFAGKPTHPDGRDDPTCADRLSSESGRCLYERSTP